VMYMADFVAFLYKRCKFHGKDIVQVLTGCAHRSYATEAKFTVKSFDLHKLESGPSTEVSCTQDDALFYYR